MGKPNIEMYHEEVLTREELLDKNIVHFNELDKKNMSELEIQTEVISNAMFNAMNNGRNVEIRDVATICAETLKEIGLENPVSHAYIESLFNFNNIYIPLYDLLDVATRYSMAGEKKSSDYRDGIIDAIITIRRFQRFSGFGEHQFIPDWNYAIDREIVEPHTH
jgi:hypothetical protein